MNIKDIDEKEIEDLREEYGAKESIRSDLDREIASLEVEIIERERLRNLAQTEYKKVLKANTKKNEALDKLEFSQTLIECFQEVVDIVKSLIVSDVEEQEIDEMFAKLMAKNS